MLINQSRFKINGNNGYLLKPEFLLNNSKFNPNDKTTFPTQIPTRYKIRIISGQQIPKPHSSSKGEVVDPYVKIRVLGAEIDKDANKQYVTKHVENNGFSPRWDEVVEFCVYLSELAFLEIVVFDKDKRSKDDKLGYSYLPMNYIREGYRNIPLFNKEGATLQPANLFFHFKIETDS
jgi:phosphatidylinositol phospholipase C delta